MLSCGRRHGAKAYIGYHMKDRQERFLSFTLITSTFVGTTGKKSSSSIDYTTLVPRYSVGAFARPKPVFRSRVIPAFPVGDPLTAPTAAAVVREVVGRIGQVQLPAPVPLVAWSYAQRLLVLAPVPVCARWVATVAVETACVVVCHDHPTPQFARAINENEEGRNLHQSNYNARIEHRYKGN